jgi:hypothetical protein
MTMHWLRLDATGASRLEPLPALAMHYQGPVDAEGYRRRARGEEPPVAHRFSTSSGVRSIQLAPDQSADILGPSAKRLTFIVSGEVILGDDAGNVAVLGRGNLFFTEGSAGLRGSIRHRGACGLVQFTVTSPWPETGATLLTPAEPPAAPAQVPNLQRLYKGEGERAYFRAFHELFAEPAGRWSAERAVAGFRICTLADGTFIDWHPEVVNQVVLVLSGEIALESSGDRRNERFLAGDVCLAEDRTGIGHTDRIHGLTALCLLVMEDIDLW